MATTEKLPSGRYRGVYYDAAGKKRHTKTKDRKKDALADARDAEQKASRQAAAETGTLYAHTTWGEWCDVWWPKRKLEMSTAATETSIRDRELTPVWGETPLNKISKRMVQDWVDSLVARKNGRGADVEANYVHRIYGIFRASINAAVEKEVLLANPCTKIRLPSIPKTRVRHFEPSELTELKVQLRARHFEAVEFLAETGLRPGEFAGLHWSSVSLDSGWMTVSDVLLKNGKVIKSKPKDEEPREVPLTTRAVELLKQWREEIPPGDGCGLPHTDGRPCRSDLVYRQKNGSPLSQNAMQMALSGALKRAKIPAGTLYSARHTFASRLAEANVDPFEIARLLGHATVRQSMNYVHRTAAARLRVLAALGDPAASALQVVNGVGRGTDRGTSASSSALPEAPSEAPRQAG